MIMFYPKVNEVKRVRISFLTAVICLAGLMQVKSAGAAEMPTGKEYTNFIGMRLVRIEPGTFRMGVGKTPLPQELTDHRGTQFDGDFDERPNHRVTITKPFYMGVHEVTRGQFTAFVKEFGDRSVVETGYGGEKLGTPWDKPGYDQTDEHPVVCVSWNDAMAFCDWLSKTVSLPTEAEWEYACRAGTKTAYQWGDDRKDGKGWCNGGDQALARRVRAKKRSGFNWDDGFAFTAPVGKFKPNAFGLYDMHGNVWEWCSDWHAQYEKGAQTDPIGPAIGEFRVIRGGGRASFPSSCRSASRHCVLPRLRTIDHGFRLVVEVR